MNRALLPFEAQAWPKFSSRALVDMVDDYDIARDDIADYTYGKLWVTPSRTTYFLCDQHADADAFHRSIIAGGGARRIGPGDAGIELTPEGRDGVWIIGGDCFDKGPSNLRLLRSIAHLRSLGAEVHVLAGNHDVRTYMGLATAGRKDPRHAHLFVRMGKKTVPLFKEVFETYLAGGESRGRHLSDDEVRELLFPPESWFEQFPEVAAGLVPSRKIAKELQRIREKSGDVVDKCAALGMDLGDLHATLAKCQELFVDPEGEFGWFFEDMQLAYRAGSFLFVHAGLDDQVASVLAEDGTDGVNDWFADLWHSDLFELYHGAVGNVFRTKYRDGIDYPFTPDGVRAAHRAGVYAIVHGHKNLLRGQRVVMRHGLLNFECDASVDSGTRAVEGLSGPGAAVTVFRPDGKVLGISSDYGYVKTFDLAHVCRTMTFV